MFHSFRECCELNKTATLKGANGDNVPTLTGVVCCAGSVWFVFARIKGARIILHVKSLTFTAAKLKDFTVVMVDVFG